MNDQSLVQRLEALEARLSPRPTDAQMDAMVEALNAWALTHGENGVPFHTLEDKSHARAIIRAALTS